MGFLSGLVDSIFGGGNDKASKSAMAGYDRANALIQPYAQSGQQDYNNYRGVINDYGNETSRYGNPYDWMWQQSSKNPQQFLRELMSGYQQTPESKYAQEQAIKAANQSAAASGMLGSGSLLKGLEQNAYDIASRDQDRYLNNVLGVNNQQMQYANDFQNQRSNYRNSLMNLANLGPQSATQMAQNEIGKANAQAMGDISKSNGWQNLIGAGLSFLPGGAGFSLARNIINKI